MLGAAGDIEHGVADTPPHAANEGAAWRVSECRVVEHGVAPTAVSPDGRGFGLDEDGDDLAAKTASRRQRLRHRWRPS